MEKLGGQHSISQILGDDIRRYLVFSSMEKGIRVFRVCCGGSDREVENKVKV